MKPGMSRPFSLMHHLMSKFKPGDLVRCQIASWAPIHTGVLLDREEYSPREPTPWESLSNTHVGWWVFVAEGSPRFFYEAHITLIQADVPGTSEDT